MINEVVNVVAKIFTWGIVGQFAVRLFDGEPNREATIYRSKAVGEPPLMLSMSVFHAIRDAIAGCGQAGALPDLPAPATPEAVLRAIDGVRRAGLG